MFRKILNNISYGIEIEGCFKEGLDYELFNKTEDSSIECDDDKYFAFEYVSNKLQYKNFKENWPKIEKVIRANYGCEEESCGGHVHMSINPELLNDLYPGDFNNFL